MPAVEPRKPAGARRKPIAGEEHLVTRQGSPAWHYDFAIDSERFRGSCRTSDFGKAAAYAAARHDEEFRRVRLGEKPALHLTLNDAFSRFYVEVARGTAYGERGQKHQLARILRILGRDTRLADLSDAMVNDLVQALRTEPLADEGPRAGKTATPGTVNRYLGTLSAVCNRAVEVWGVEVGAWKRRIHKQAEPPPVQRFLDHDVARKVMSLATPHIRPVLMLDVMTGLRKGNMVGLTWEQIDLRAGTAAVIQKGGRLHTVALPAPALRLLEAIQPDPAKRVGPVFVYGNPAVPCDCPACKRADMRGQAMENPKRSIKTAFRRAGLPATTRFHDLRHTFASWLLNSGGDLRLVQEALGHANITTTMRYAGVMAGRKAAVVGAVAEALTGPALVIDNSDKEKVA